MGQLPIAIGIGMAKIGFDAIYAKWI